MKLWIPQLVAGVDRTRVTLATDEVSLLGHIDGTLTNFDLSVRTGLSLHRVQQLLFRLFVEGIVGRAGGELAALFIDDAVPTRESSGFEPYDMSRTLPLATAIAAGAPIATDCGGEYESEVPTVQRSLVGLQTTCVRPPDPDLLVACTDWGAAFAHTAPRASAATAPTSVAEAPVITGVTTVVLLTEAIDQQDAAPPTTGRSDGMLPLTTPGDLRTQQFPVTDGGFSLAATTQEAPKPATTRASDLEMVSAPKTTVDA